MHMRHERPDSVCPQAPNNHPIQRRSARVVLLNDADQLLLFSLSAHSDPGGLVQWITVGGRLEKGETYEQAALRELREETGLTGVALGPEVWRERPWTWIRNGVAYEVRQRYYFIRAPVFQVDTSLFEQEERSAITGYLWWTLQDLAAATDVLRPTGLPALMAALISSGPPGEAIPVDG